MIEAYRRHCLVSLIERALPSIEPLDTPQRAECFDGIQFACATHAPDLANAAQAAATALRDADSRQLKLKLMLTQETNANSETPIQSV